jgi:hypothetical protein
MTARASHRREPLAGVVLGGGATASVVTDMVDPPEVGARHLAHVVDVRAAEESDVVGGLSG